MTPERWRQIKDVFTEVKALQPHQRGGFLTDVCENDDALLEEVRALLDADESAGIVDQFRNSLVSALNLYPQDTIRAGQKISHYLLQEEIGRGGMGIVYEAYDDRLNRKVALKFLPPKLSEDSDLKARFMQEARAASALDHPNICTIYDVGEADGTLYLVMAHYSGETLAERMKTTPPDVEESLFIVSQIAKGLDKAHASGIVHRDIKPSNIILTDDGGVKILDFGIAKFAGNNDITNPEARMGTIAYMSPEQMRGESVDHRTDIWSLGVVLYEMLAGKHPFRAAQDAATMFSVLESSVAPVSDLRGNIPVSVDTIIGRTLEKSASDRYDSLTELIQDIADITSGSTLRALQGDAQKVALKTDLPAVLTSFIGRDTEVAQILQLLRETRLITLTGPGGTGKTRLSIEAASRAATDFAGKVAFVSLASIRNPNLVPSAISQAMGLKEDKTRSHLDHLILVLKNRSILLILDNFEQVVGAAPFISTLLTSCPNVKAIVTSRIALHISGEQIFPVLPLPLPPADAELNAASISYLASTALFEARSRAVNPGFAITDENASVVSEICRRLDGIPLAIELAAARIKLFPPEALLERLEQRLDLLTTGHRDLPSRHQTLRQAIAWSYNLLTEETQAIFRTLSIFVGGCSLEAIEAVVSACLHESVDGLAGVSTLLDHNLLRRDDDNSGSRFYMLETIREFGIEQLKETDEYEIATQEHTTYFLTIAEQTEQNLTGPDLSRHLDLLEKEHDNFRAAISRAERTGNLKTCLRFVGALWRFWSTRGFINEAIKRSQTLLDHPEAAEANVYKARALSGLGVMCFFVGRLHESSRYLQESLTIFESLGDEQSIAIVLNHLGWVANEHGDFKKSLELSTRALDIHRSLQNLRGVAVSLNNLVWKANYCGEYEEAVRLGKESLKMRREIEDVRGIAYANVNLSWSEIVGGRYERALDLLHQNLPALQDIGDQLILAWSYMLEGLIWLERGDDAKARTLLIDCMEIWSRENHQSGLAWVLSLLAEIDADRSLFASAASKLRYAEEIWVDHGNRWGEGMANLRFGFVAIKKRELHEAKRHFLDSLQHSHAVQNKRGIAGALEQLALIFTENKEFEQATELLGSSADIREKWKLPVQPRYREAFDNCIEKLRNELGTERFEALWEEGKLPIDVAVEKALLASEVKFVRSPDYRISIKD